jgi:hypothetical protein
MRVGSARVRESMALLLHGAHLKSRLRRGFRPTKHVNNALQRHGSSAGALGPRKRRTAAADHGTHLYKTDTVTQALQSDSSSVSHRTGHCSSGCGRFSSSLLLLLQLCSSSGCGCCCSRFCSCSGLCLFFRIASPIVEPASISGRFGCHFSNRSSAQCLQRRRSWCGGCGRVYRINVNIHVGGCDNRLKVLALLTDDTANMRACPHDREGARGRRGEEWM